MLISSKDSVHLTFLLFESKPLVVYSRDNDSSKVEFRKTNKSRSQICEYSFYTCL